METRTTPTQRCLTSSTALHSTKAKAWQIGCLRCFRAVWNHLSIYEIHYTSSQLGDSSGSCLVLGDGEKHEPRLWKRRKWDTLKSTRELELSHHHFLSIGMRKHWPRTTWREMMFSSYNCQVTVHHWGKSRQGLRTGTWKECLKQRPRMNSLITGLPLLAYAATLLTQPRDDTAHSELDPHEQIENQESNPQMCQQVNLIVAIPKLRFSLPGLLKFVSTSFIQHTTLIRLCGEVKAIFFYCNPPLSRYLFTKFKTRMAWTVSEGKEGSNNGRKKIEKRADGNQKWASTRCLWLSGFTLYYWSILGCGSRWLFVKKFIHSFFLNLPWKSFGLN